jgi:glycosyltransferase involved in cell wall biosynthesis
VETNDHLLSVVLNVWKGDSPELLLRSISSIFSQTNPPDEMVIVIDGPVPESLSRVISSCCKESLIKVLVHRIEVNVGLAEARNTGIGVAQGELIALHDADDVMHPYRLELQKLMFNDNELDLVCSPAVEFDTDTHEIIGVRDACIDISGRKLAMFWNNAIPHSTVMMRRRAFDIVGGYRSVYLAEDYDLWIRFLASGARISCLNLAVQALGIDSKHASRRGGISLIKTEMGLSRAIETYFRIPKFFILARLVLRVGFRLVPSLVRQVCAQLLLRSSPPRFPRNLSEFQVGAPLEVR